MAQNEEATFIPIKFIYIRRSQIGFHDDWGDILEIAKEGEQLDMEKLLQWFPKSNASDKWEWFNGQEKDTN